MLQHASRNTEGGGNHGREEIMRVWDLSTNKSLIALHILHRRPLGQNPLGRHMHKDERDPAS